MLSIFLDALIATRANSRQHRAIQHSSSVGKLRIQGLLVQDSLPPECHCCVLEQETLSTVPKVSLEPGERPLDLKSTTEPLGTSNSYNGSV